MRNAIFFAHEIISKPHHDTVRLRLDLTGRFFVSQAVHKMFTFSAAHFTALIR